MIIKSNDKIRFEERIWPLNQLNLLGLRSACALRRLTGYNTRTVL